ncbi:MAG: aspartate--tRNA ligase [Bacilli bacterium]|nr:aspartate--tRNA ligase [Bacilli bacterium]
MYRTKNNGELRLNNVGEHVQLVGWVSKKRNFGSIVFIDLRDRYGITQIVFSEKFSEITSKIRNEYIICIEGNVVERQNKNSALSTGDIEVSVDDVKIVNTAELTPLIIADDTDALEDTRMKYRYLDLRRPVMQKNLITRHKIVKSFRAFLDDEDFIEVETPILAKTTPEGARDYLVPSRVNPGKFYALPQSPQLFKQLLMIAGFEKYYQVARCFRDEDLRADRQPDFTQIDIETSFMSELEIMTLLEKMFSNMLENVVNYDLKLPLRRISFKDALNRYGSDKPDTRFGYELMDISNILNKNETFIIKDALMNDGMIKAIKIDGKSSEISRKNIDELTEIAKKNHAKGLMWMRFVDNNLEGQMSKILSENEKNELINALELKNDDMVFAVAGKEWEYVCTSLGSIRSVLGKKFKQDLLVGYDMLWIIDFPLFDYDYENHTYSSTHHPFTRPYDEDIPLLYTNPHKVRAHHYDLVLNGYELGSGSLRIYDQEIQRKVFDIIGLSKEEIDNKFGFFINAFKYGTPPHGGVAFGIDRIAMILCGCDNIRDVIAFPKNASAVCPMTEAPTEVSQQQLDELSININVKK